MGLRKTIFGCQNFKANTFIGGVSASIGTAAALATKLQISTGRISNFKVVGNDIQCKISGGIYAIPGNCFRDDSTITYYNDSKGLVTNILAQGFRSCVNLTYVNFPNVTVLESYVFEGAKLSGVIDFPKLTNVGTNVLVSMTGLCTINMPVVTKLGGNTLFYISTDSTLNINIALKTSNSGKPDANLSSSGIRRLLVNYIDYNDDISYNTEIGGTVGNSYITDKRTLAEKLALGSGAIDNFQNISGVLRFKATEKYGFSTNAFQNRSDITYYDDSIIGNVGNIADGAFYNCANLEWLKFYGTAIGQVYGGSAVRNCPNLILTDMPNAITFGHGYWGRNCPKLRSISLPNVTKITTGATFYGDGNSLKDFYMPKLIQCGPTTGNDSIFYSIYAGGTITVNSALQTADNGAVDGDLVYAANSRGATIVYVS